MARVMVQAEDFDVGFEIGRLGHAGDTGSAAGAVASFVGVVRSGAAEPITAMTLEHYPGMTEAAIAAIVAEAEARFDIMGCTVIHRVGRLLPGARIVFVGVAAAHRHAALDAVGFLIDWLKTRAPFWKQEELSDGGSRWVEAKLQDDEAAARW